MCFWIVVLKSIGSFIGFYRIDKNIIGLPFTKFNERITNTYMIKYVMNSRLKDFLLNSPSARPKKKIFFQALVQIKVYFHATLSFKMRSLNIAESNSFLLLGHIAFNKIFH